MYSSVLYSAALVASIASAAPTAKRDFSPDNVYFPLSNGFPNPSQDQLLQIQKDAHGTLSNAPPPAKISPDGITSLQMIALNEIGEVAFFTELVYNVTNKVKGYDLGYGHEYVLDALNSIVAQEELHLINANNALKNFKQDPILPCKYSFPVTDFQSAIGLAATFTDLVLGTLQDINQIFALNGDTGLIRGVSSTLGNEAEQEGFFRLIQKKRPSSKPFLTTSTRDFAFTAIQSFTVPGSCPSTANIKLKTFKALTVETMNIQPVTQNLKFSISKKDAGMFSMDQFKVVYINGQNLPVVKSLMNMQTGTDKITFEAPFPFDENVLGGFTIAAITQGKDSFASAVEVAAATIFGPGLIEVD